MRRTCWVVAMGATALSCADAKAPSPLRFGRPQSYQAACSDDRVVADESTMVSASEVMRSASGWTVTVGGSLLHFHGFGAKWEPRNDDGSLGPFCRQAKQAEEADTAREVDGVCLLGIDWGEWGGWLEAIEPGPPPVRYAIARGNTLGIVAFGADGQSFMAISGVMHGFPHDGAAYRLTRRSDGKWCRAQGVDLRGAPVGWRVEGPRSFALLVEVLEPDPRRFRFWYAVMRLDDEGRPLPAP